MRSRSRDVYLHFAGDDRFGALGVSTSPEDYLPRRLGPLPTLADTSTIQELVHKVVRRVVKAVNGWREHFAAAGVSRRDLAHLEEQIDRPFLKDQRRALT